MTRALKASRDEARAMLNVQYRNLVDRINEYPLIADDIQCLISEGMRNPEAVIGRMEVPEIQLLFLLAHIGLGEGLLRACDPDRE